MLRAIFVTGLIALGALSLPASAGYLDEEDFDPACFQGQTLMLPVGEPLHGQAGSAAQLYSGVTPYGDTKYAVSWVLETNSMSVGLDKSGFYVEVISDEPYAMNGFTTFFEEDRLSGKCKIVGTVRGTGVHDWWVQGGGTGWATEKQCEYSIWGSFTAGIKVGPLGGASGSVTLGTTFTCGSGAKLDSEVLISEDNHGSACLPLVGCHIDELNSGD